MRNRKKTSDECNGLLIWYSVIAGRGPPDPPDPLFEQFISDPIATQLSLLLSQIEAGERSQANEAHAREQYWESLTAVPRSHTTVPAGLFVDDVQFTLTAPALLMSASAYEIRFWVHLEEQRSTVIELARESHSSSASGFVLKSEGPFQIERGAELSIRLEIEGFDCADDHKSVTWTGHIGSTTFVVRVPKDTRHGAHEGSASIRMNGLQIARMSFVLNVGEEEHENAVIPNQMTSHRSAFASYASQDRAAVLARIQGMQKAYKDLKVFLDAVDLRSGEYWESELTKEISQSDVFYLFWCRHARASEWVEKEWRWALQQKGLDFIDPVPLEGPQYAPPPSELAAKHFNDPLLAHMCASGDTHSNI